MVVPEQSCHRPCERRQSYTESEQTVRQQILIPLTVVYDPTYGQLVMPEQEQEELVAVTRGSLATVASGLETEEVLVHTEVLEGAAATSIVSYAEHDLSIRLIAMASHGRSGVGRLVFGSVAAKVLQVTTTPLLVPTTARSAPLPGRRGQADRWPPGQL